ncbi:hypothetical protein AVEN_108869-1 [Araneus ventricosus]|uniref:Uncharacterized protein n=1 Tax=Araneus ventricosus TaxID=182803 RepID=A0A4Y2V0F4_ARAVE|nr:hypothetical protein AVEN_108869-1 [Araneus ventricosus]
MGCNHVDCKINFFASHLGNLSEDLGSVRTENGNCSNGYLNMASSFPEEMESKILPTMLNTENDISTSQAKYDRTKSQESGGCHFNMLV